MADLSGIVESGERAEVLADVLKGIGHPARLRIVAALCRSSRNVGELAGLLGFRQAMVSQHLSLLRLHGLVASKKNGTRITYFLKEKRLKKLIECLAGCKQHPAAA